MGGFSSLLRAGGKGGARDRRSKAHFHGLVAERCGNHLLLYVWQQMTQ
ncbi:hypothetical protein [Variovorax sp. PAMC 28711]|nr:hypothetical protein [Variovorax sp. PAMC 28711]